MVAACTLFFPDSHQIRFKTQFTRKTNVVMRESLECF